MITSSSKVLAVRTLVLRPMGTLLGPGELEERARWRGVFVLFDPQHVELIGLPFPSTPTSPPSVDLTHTPWPNVQTIFIRHVKSIHHLAESLFASPDYVGAKGKQVSMVVDFVSP